MSKRRKYPKVALEGDTGPGLTRVAITDTVDTDADRIKRSYELAKSGNARVWNTDELGGGENGIGTGQHFVTFEMERNWVHVWPLHAPKGHLSQVVALRVWERIRMEVSTAVAAGLGYSATDPWIDEEEQKVKETKSKPRKKKKAVSTPSSLTTAVSSKKSSKKKVAKKLAASAPVTISKSTKKKKVTKVKSSPTCAAAVPVTKSTKKKGGVPAAPPIPSRSRRSKKKATSKKVKEVSATFPCLCGCGETTDRYFYRYGHQPRFEGWLRKIAAGATREEVGMPKRLYNKLGPWRAVKGVTIEGGEAPTVHYTELRQL